MRYGCALAGAFWAFALCWSGAPAGAQAPSRGRIVLITHKPEGFRNAFWDSLRGGGEQAAKAAGFALEYRGVAASFGGTRPRPRTRKSGRPWTAAPPASS